MIYSPAHGDTAFTVPLFNQFMKRVMPSLPKKKLRALDWPLALEAFVIAGPPLAVDFDAPRPQKIRYRAARFRILSARSRTMAS
jgi:hypothetical protein